MILALLLLIAGLAGEAQDPEELYQQGARLFAAHNNAGAIEAFAQSVRIRPGFAAGWMALGAVYAAGGDYESAEKPLGTACKLQPGLPDACLYYGRTLYLLNRFQQAIEVLREALQNDKENGQLHRFIALSLEALGQTAEAGTAFHQAMRLDRGSASNDDPGIDYGVYLFRQGRTAEALAPLENVLGRHPDSSRAHLELGCALLASERLVDAQSHLERAVALDPQSSRAHLLLGKVYLRLGKTAAAEEQLRQGSRTVQ